MEIRYNNEIGTIYIYIYMMYSYSYQPRTQYTFF